MLLIAGLQDDIYGSSRLIGRITGTIVLVGLVAYGAKWLLNRRKPPDVLPNEGPPPPPPPPGGPSTG